LQKAVANLTPTATSQKTNQLLELVFGVLPGPATRAFVASRLTEVI